MSKFKVGDKVVLKDGYEFKSQQVGTGKICSTDANNWYRIKWENESENSYKEEGMILVKDYKSTTPKAPTYLVVWDESCGDPCRFFTSESDAKEFIKELGDKSNVVKDSIILVEIKSCKKVTIHKRLDYRIHKI